MADHAEQSGGAAEKSSGGSLMKIILAAGFLLMIIGAELAIAFFVFPSAEDVMAMAQAQQAAQADEHGEEHASPAEATSHRGHGGDSHGSNGGHGSKSGHGASGGHKERLEISLGEFSVSAYQPLSNSTLRIDFELFGVVSHQDEAAMTQLLDENKHRLREQVLVIIRSAEMSDLTDAGLGLIKRKILEKTNRALGKALIQEIIFSDFSFVEQ